MMTNRLAMALAVTAGYVLGRTKKAKLAIGVGGMVLGKRLKLNPQQLTGLVTEQLRNNPQLGEVRDQLRGDLTGVGKAATGALVTRQLDSLADRLHDRTLGVRDRLAGGDGSGAAGADREDADREDEAGPADGPADGEPPERRRPAKKTAAGGTTAKRTAAGKAGSGKDGSDKARARKTGAGTAGAKKAAAQRAPAGKRAASATGGAKKAAAPVKQAAKKPVKKAAGRRPGGDSRG